VSQSVAGDAPGPGRIHLLDRSVAEAIAAGEVIDRPAAAVKELVENSLDAGATKIAVEVLGGGAELIRVVDNGHGMSPGEMAVAFERHATSKLREMDDLLQLTTFGFRGEALASIVAVARVTAISRASGSDRGFELQRSGSDVRGPVATAAPVGTSVLARDLFFNVPARREFLRSARSEATACFRVVSEAALGRPDVSFEARTGIRVVVRTPGHSSLAQAVSSIFGAEAAAALLEVHLSDGSVEVTGVLCAPQLSRQTRQSMVVMVNGRRIQHRGLLAAVEGAYRGLLPTDRYPLAVLDVRCDPAGVDVNVHPTKREVRLKDERRFFDLVQRACWTALQTAAPRSLALPAATILADQSGTGSFREQSPSGPSFSLTAREAAEHVAGSGERMSTSLREASSWRYLGQAHNRYLVVETGDGLALLDQHAAHEKVLYAQGLRQLAGDMGEPVLAQALLDPPLIQVPAPLLDALQPARATLARIGFEVEQFGQGTLRCTAVPPQLRLSELESVLLEALEAWEDRDATEAALGHRLAASVACHSAVRFGDQMARVEVDALLRDLAGTEGGITCPHGRPAVLLLSEDQLLTAFHRR
jgi:DNA mismatch repair protein MutL